MLRKRTLLASQLLWAAIFIAAFILWAWLDSIYNYSGILVYGRKNAAGFWQEPGRARVMFLHGDPVSAKPDLGYERSKRKEPGEVFPSFAMMHSSGARPSLNLFIPYWAIFGGHVLFMSALIAWRHRKREVIVDPPPAS